MLLPILLFLLFKSFLLFSLGVSRRLLWYTVLLMTAGGPSVGLPCTGWVRPQGKAGSLGVLGVLVVAAVAVVVVAAAAAVVVVVVALHRRLSCCSSAVSFSSKTPPPFLAVLQGEGVSIVTCPPMISPSSVKGPPLFLFLQLSPSLLSPSPSLLSPISSLLSLLSLSSISSISPLSSPPFLSSSPVGAMQRLGVG